MIGIRRALLVLGVVAAALVGIGIATVAGSHHLGEDKVPAAILVTALMTSYCGVGLYAWWRRPANRVGMLMTAAGFAAWFTFLQGANSSLLFTLGMVLGGGIFFAIGVHMLLAFPSGRLETGLERRLVGFAYGFALALPLFIAFFDPDCDCEFSDTQPANAFNIADHPTVAQVFETVGGLAGLVLVGVAAWILVGRVRAAGPRERRALAPLLSLGSLMLVLLGVSFAFDIPGDGGDGVESGIDLAGYVTFVLLPYAFLAGLARTRGWRAGAIVDAIQAMAGARDPMKLCKDLGDALDDPTLEVGFWLPDRGHYVDVVGHVIDPPAEGDPGRVMTDVEREGRRIGALIHERRLVEDDPELVRVVASGASLALENARLEAELRARVEELERSRARIVDVALSERRRLERDLHDGAQQRLVALSLQLGLIAAKLDKDPAGAGELLDGARGEARDALEDLRELARGIHPAVLTDRGLPAALESLADRAPLPVEVSAVPAERLPGAVEAAAYFVVAESLTNVAKYAQASHASVRVDRQNGYALIEVRDDGVGGADPAAGSGLRGLADRLAALDGRLEVDSAPGRGTVVRARVPCGS